MSRNPIETPLPILMLRVPGVIILIQTKSKAYIPTRKLKIECRMGFRLSSSTFSNATRDYDQMSHRTHCIARERHGSRRPGRVLGIQGYCPKLKGYGIFLQIFKGILDT